MKVDLSPEEAALIQYAIVHTDEFWKPEGKHWKKIAQSNLEW